MVPRLEEYYIKLYGGVGSESGRELLHYDISGEQGRHHLVLKAFSYILTSAFLIAICQLRFFVYVSLFQDRKSVV